MIFGTVFGKRGLFSNKNLAERALAKCIKISMNLGANPEMQEFERLYTREDYSGCVKIWNDFVKTCYSAYDAHKYQAVIEIMEFDAFG